MALPRMIPIIRDQFTWTLLELPSAVVRESPFITSDNPVALSRPRKRGEGARLRGTRLRDPAWNVSLGGGWNERGVEVTLPLSPGHALLLTRDPHLPNWAKDPRQMAHIVRVRAVRNARDWVFATDEDERVRELVRATPRPRVEIIINGTAYGPDVSAATIHAHITRARVEKVGIRYGS
jgi:hypothetical protein